MGKLSEIVYKKVDELHEHPLNDEIFGHDPEADKFLLQSIQEKGINHPLIITPEGKIISGHRRFRIAKLLKHEKVPCRIFYPEYPGEEEEIFIETNLTQRRLTPVHSHRALEYYEQIRMRDMEKLKSKLLPELREALERKEINIAIARAIARFPLEEQKKFINLVGTRFKYANQVKVEELRKKLVEYEKYLREKDKLINQLTESKNFLEKELQQAQKDKKIYEQALSEFQEEKKQLEKRIFELEEKLGQLKRENNSEKINELKAQLNQLRELLQIKESEIKEYKEKVKGLNEEIDDLSLRLEEKEKQIEKVKQEIEEKAKQKLQEEIKKLKENPPLPFKPNPWHKIMGILQALIFHMTSLWDELNRSDIRLTEEEKKEAEEVLKEVESAVQLVRNILRGRDSLAEALWKEEQKW